MLTQKVKDYFEKYKDLKVLFFFDTAEEYKNEIEAWQEKDIELVFAGDEQFGLKYKLECELKNKKVFLYYNSAIPVGNERKHFALMDILIANKVLHIDDVEDFMQEYNLKPYQRDLTKKYITHLKLKKNQKTLSKILRFDNFEEYSLRKGLISCFLNSNLIDEETILLAKLFISVMKNESEFVISKVKEINAVDIICKLIDEYFEIENAVLTNDLLMLAIRKFKYNLITQNISKPAPTDDYSHLKINKPKRINLINMLAVDWQRNDKISPLFEEVFDKLAKDISEENLVKLYGIETEYGIYNSKITIKILIEITTIIDFNPDRVITMLSIISTHLSTSQQGLKEYIGYLIRCANIFKILNSITGYIFDKPKNYVEKYIEQYQFIDYNYRKALLKLEILRTMDLPHELDIASVTSKLNSKYEEYLKEMNTQWLRCLQEHEFEFNNLPFRKQHDFYKHYIEETDQKIAVIISDGLRYEAATELMDVLHNDPKHQIEIDSMIAGLPSNTKQGMANLLPNKEIQFKNDLFLVDNFSTEGIENREKILQNYNSDSKAIQFDKLNHLSQDEARELFKSQIVYIYHNRIDAIGDDKKTEKHTLDAVEKTISELVPIIKKIHSSYNVSKVIITADHGFLYNPVELPESMYETLPDKNAIVNHNRFSILKSKIKTDSYIFDLSKASSVKSDLQITIPKAINRYKRQGHGTLYVHGGASLQEMIIPVIESMRKREDVAEKVTFKLMNKELKIVSSAIKLKFIQEKPVNKYYKELNLLCGIYGDGNELVSSEINLVLDSTSELPTQRTKEIILNLSAKSSSSSIYYLKVFDQEKDPNKLNPLLKEKVINQTLIKSEF